MQIWKKVVSISRFMNSSLYKSQQVIRLQGNTRYSAYKRPEENVVEILLALLKYSFQNNSNNNESYIVSYFDF